MPPPRDRSKASSKPGAPKAVRAWAIMPDEHKRRGFTGELQVFRSRRLAECIWGRDSITRVVVGDAKFYKLAPKLALPRGRKGGSGR